MIPLTLNHFAAIFLLPSLAFAAPSADTLLSDMQTPCAYEYKFCQPNVATVLGGERVVHFIMPDDSTVFSSEVSQYWSSTILIERCFFLWHYTDDVVGDVWFTGEVDLGDRTPEKVLGSLDFPHHDRVTINREVSRVLGTTKAVKTNQKTSDAALGFTIPDESKPSQSLLIYNAWKELPEWSKVELSNFKRDSRSVTNVRACPGKLKSLATLLDQVGEESQKVPIPLPRLESVAKRMNYMLPTVGQITKAIGVTVDIPQKELDLSMTYRDSAYDIAQYNSRITVIDSFVKRSKRVGPWELQVIHDPGTNAKLTYALGDSVTLICDGAKIDDMDFTDLILSFRMSPDVVRPENSDRSP